MRDEYQVWVTNGHPKHLHTADTRHDAVGWLATTLTVPREQHGNTFEIMHVPEQSAIRHIPREEQQDPDWYHGRLSYRP